MTSSIKKLLIIEDKPGNWEILEKESLKSNFPVNITLVSNLRDYRNKFKESQFHVVVSDYFLKDGVCTDITSELGGIPLIVMVNEGQEELALLSLNSGASDYLVKDSKQNYKKLLPLTSAKSIELKCQSDELQKYKTQLENIVEERTVELIEMYSKLQDSETNFKNIFKCTNDGIVIVDYNIQFVECNDAILNQFSVTKEFLSSVDLMSYVVPSYKSILLERLDLVKKGLPSGIVEIEFISPLNGNILPYEISCVPVVFNQKLCVLAIMRDLAERKNHERKLIETIIQTEEEERLRIARDLHDEIGPLISALKIFTTSFIESPGKEKKDKLAKQIGTIVREVIDSVKTLSNDMSPHVLLNFGLLAAIQNFINIFSNSIKIKLITNLKNTRFPTPVESLVYRIIKELINNTIKHAQADEINIKLDYINSNLLCCYRDNGKGFDWNHYIKSPGKGMGLNNIIARIHSLGGEFRANTEPQKGFEIIFELQTISRL